MEAPHTSIERSTKPTVRDGKDLIKALAQDPFAIGKQDLGAESSDIFPADALERLRRLGALLAPLPKRDDGFGWGTESAGVPELCTALQQLGYASLPVGRVYEAHVNALTLICRFAHNPLRAACWSAARSGNLFGLWVAPSAEPVRLLRTTTTLRLVGRKAFCSAAGFATRAVVTALDDRDRERMILVDVTQPGVTYACSPDMHGMRNTSTKPVAFDLEVHDTQFVGEAGDYLREPEFSAGAWRTSAVTAGGLRALVDETMRQLHARMRHTDPHQSARLGHMLIKSETAILWANALAERVATPPSLGQDLTSFVNLGRAAIEQCCIKVIPLVQQCLGLRSLMTSNPAEKMMRDLATYLRQPAGDEALSEAAMWIAERGLRQSPADPS